MNKPLPPSSPRKDLVYKSCRKSFLQPFCSEESIFAQSRRRGAKFEGSSTTFEACVEYLEEVKEGALPGGKLPSLHPLAGGRTSDGLGNSFW